MPLLNSMGVMRNMTMFSSTSIIGINYIGEFGTIRVSRGFYDVYPTVGNDNPVNGMSTVRTYESSYANLDVTRMDFVQIDSNGDITSNYAATESSSFSSSSINSVGNIIVTTLSNYNVTGSSPYNGYYLSSNVVDGGYSEASTFNSSNVRFTTTSIANATTNTTSSYIQKQTGAGNSLSLSWTKQLSYGVANSRAIVNSLATDSSNNVYGCGTFMTLQPAISAYKDAGFIFKADSNGNLQWIKTSSNTIAWQSIAITNDSYYVCGLSDYLLYGSNTLYAQPYGDQTRYYNYSIPEFTQGGNLNATSYIAKGSLTTGNITDSKLVTYDSSNKCVLNCVTAEANSANIIVSGFVSGNSVSANGFIMSMSTNLNVNWQNIINSTVTTANPNTSGYTSQTYISNVNDDYKSDKVKFAGSINDYNTNSSSKLYVTGFSGATDNSGIAGNTIALNTRTMTCSTGTLSVVSGNVSASSLAGYAWSNITATGATTTNTGNLTVANVIYTKHTF